MEGAATTREVAKEMLKTDRRPVDRSKQMILNNFLTMRETATVKQEPLSEALILKTYHFLPVRDLEERLYLRQGHDRTIDVHLT